MNFCQNSRTVSFRRNLPGFPSKFPNQTWADSYGMTMRINLDFCFFLRKWAFHLPFLAIFSIIFLVPSFSQTKNKNLTVELDPQNPRVGEPFQLTFRLENMDGEWLGNPNFGDLQKLSGPNPEFFTQIINGKMTKRISWSFMLRAGREGNFQVGAARIRAEKQVLATDVFNISVKQAAPAPKTNGNRQEDIFIATELSTEKAVVGQQIVASFVMYTAIGAESFDLFDEPNFDGFFTRPLDRFGSRGREVTVGKKKYIARTLKAVALFPQKTGRLTVPPMRFAVSVATNGESDDPFSHFFGRPTRQLALESEEKFVDVRALPEPVPQNFSGGVGNYNWKITADPSDRQSAGRGRRELSTDEALTLTFKIEGNGDAQKFSLPALVLPEGLEAFEPKILEEETFENGDELLHSKTVEIAVLPRQTGTFTIAPKLTFFSPDSNRYVSLGTNESLTINVLAGKNGSKINQAPGDGGQISGLRTSANWQSEDNFWVFSTWFWLAVAAPFLVTFSLFLRQFFQQKMVEKNAKKLANSPELKAKKLSENLHRQFAECREFLKKNDAPHFYESLEKTLTDYFSTKLNIAPAEFSHKLVLEKLSEKNISPSLIENLNGIFRQIEMARFAGAADFSKMGNVLAAAEQFFLETKI